MFDFLKKAFSKPDQEPAPTVTAPAKPAAAQPAPAPQPASVPKPAPVAAQPAPEPKPAAPAPAAPVTGDTVKIAIIDIVPKLPAELAPLPGANATGSISIPVSTVISQLAGGAVRVRFAQIREAAPQGTFPTAPELGEKMIDLPLPKILSMINPALLTRRSGQKQIELSDEVGGVFGPKGKPVSSGHAVAAPVAPGTAAPIAAKPEPVAPAPVPAPVIPAPVPIPAPAPVAAAAPVAPIAPAPAPVQQKPPTSIASPPSAPKMPASSPLPFASQKPAAPPPAPAPLPFAQKPAAASPPPAAAPLPFATQKPAAAPAPAPAPVSTPAPAPAPAAAPMGGGLILQLSAISESWPEPVRQEIAQNKLTGASVALPMNRVDTGMKTGRVSFTWGELSQWLDGGSVPASPNKDMLLELPLKVIIPLFMAQRQAGATQKKVSIGENIPNLFAGLTVAPVQAPVAEPPAPGPAPVSASDPEPITAIAPDPVTAVTVPAVPPPAAAPASVLGEIFGQPAKKDWSPQEIAQKLKTLPGISAALIAMADGLLVAGDLPAPLKSDTLAAFLPQMFGRMNHYAEETQLGAITALTMQTGQGQCAIFKAGALFVAVLGKSGETLPDAALHKVASELAKRT